MIRVLSVFGTRPEAIKMAPIIREIQRRQGPEAKVCVTGQHREMLDQVLDLFGICPDYNLDVMTENQTLCQVGAAVLAKLGPVLDRERPDWVLVQGDTTTVAAAALAAYYAECRVGHVEAGLRTRDKWQPFPEEINRRVAGVIADVHFAPTEHARQNLRAEGVPAEQILVTGNPVIDALQWAAQQPFDLHSLGIPGLDSDSRGGKVILVTAHRRENLGAPLESISLALRDLAERFGGRLRIVFPVHRNPRVCGPVHYLLKGIPGISLLPPLDYLALVHLLKCADLVLTDSGGIQEEAPGLGKPVLVLREVTERPEAVSAGTVRLVGTQREHIVAEVTELLQDSRAYNRMARAVNPYGDGHAAERIVNALCESPALNAGPPSTAWQRLHAPIL